jgi:hypothetical protein
MNTKYNDQPLLALAESANLVIESGGVVFFKWTCAGCGDRVTATTPNTFTHFSKHEDCGHVTDTLKSGGNYVAIKPLTPNGDVSLSDLLAGIMSEPDSNSTVN